jgi:hypothetical protein
MKKLYYVVTPHFDSSDSLNGIRTIDVYSIENNEPRTFAELESLSDDLGDYFKSDEEEIQDYLDDNGYGDEEFDFIQL